LQAKDLLKILGENFKKEYGIMPHLQHHKSGRHSG
jgi:hypothetical protein